MIEKEKHNVTLLQNNLVVFLLAAVACALWGTAFPILKLSYVALDLVARDTYGEILFASYRFFLAGLMVFAYLAFRHEKIRLSSLRDYWQVFLLGLFQTSFQYFFFYVGLAHTTGVKASIIGASGSFFAVLISHFIYTNDKINIYKIIGLVSGFSGVLLINLNKGTMDFNITFLGEVFLILSALVSTIGSVLAKGICTRISPVVMTAYQLVLGAALLFLVAVTGVSPTHLNFNPLAWGMLVYLAFLSAAAFVLWYMILKYNPLGKIAIYRFLIPVFGVLFSAWLLPEESLNATVLTALLMVCMGIIAVNYQGLVKTLTNREKAAT